MNYDHHKGWSRLTTKGIIITLHVCFVLQLYSGAQYSITLHFKVNRNLTCYPTEHTILQMCLWLSPTQLTTACNGWLLHSESTRNSLHSNRESYSLYSWTIQQHDSVRNSIPDEHLLMTLLFTDTVSQKVLLESIQSR